MENLNGKSQAAILGADSYAIYECFWTRHSCAVGSPTRAAQNGIHEGTHELECVSSSTNSNTSIENEQDRRIVPPGDSNSKMPEEYEQQGAESANMQSHPLECNKADRDEMLDYNAHTSTQYSMKGNETV